MKTLIRAAERKQRGRMRPAVRQFDMPDLYYYYISILQVEDFFTLINQKQW